MKRKMLSCLLLALLLAVAAPPVLAAGHYVSLRGGLGWSDDVDRAFGSDKSSLSYKDPWEMDLAVGHRFDFLRLEGELGYMKTSVDELTNSGGAKVPVSGEDKHLKLMINCLLDWRNRTPFTPFVGGGVGAAYVHQDVDMVTVRGGKRISIDDKTWDFAYQLMAGVNWAVNADWSVDLMYRFYGVSDRTHDLTGGDNTSVEIDPHHTHWVLLGVRYAF